MVVVVAAAAAAVVVVVVVVGLRNDVIDENKPVSLQILFCK